jgi:hypothetical protein
MTYAIVALLATVATCQGFAIEITKGNITHVRHGREPNAGAAIFPNIPTVPLLAVGGAWILNQCWPNLGFWAIIALFCLHQPFWWYHLRQLNREFDQLKGDAANAD